MNTRSILLALCVSAAATTWAQTATPAATPATATTATPATPDNTVDRAAAYHDNLVKELALTPEQDAALIKIDEEHRQSAKELNRANLETEERQKRARALRDAKDAAVKNVLSAEQYEKFLQIRKEKRDNGAQQTKSAQPTPSHQE